MILYRFMIVYWYKLNLYGFNLIVRLIYALFQSFCDYKKVVNATFQIKKYQNRFFNITFIFTTILIIISTHFLFPQSIN